MAKPQVPNPAAQLIRSCAAVANARYLDDQAFEDATVKAMQLRRQFLMTLSETFQHHLDLQIGIKDGEKESVSGSPLTFR
jgi:hypothetical protein